MRTRVLVVAFASLLAIACGHRAERTGKAAVTDVLSTISGQPTGEPESKFKSYARAFGNEPFWSVYVRENSLYYVTPQLDLVAPLDSVELDGDTAAFRATDPMGRPLVLKIQRGVCADTMADETYSLRAEVEAEGRTASGCARMTEDT